MGFMSDLLSPRVPVILQSEAPDDRVQNVDIFTWINSGSLHIDFGLLLDPLSVTFVLPA